VALQINAEQSSDVFNTMLTRPADSDRLTDVQSIVDRLEQSDFSNESINAFVKQRFLSKPVTLVSIGNLDKMPFVDDLKA
jgi:hypothetical protein